MSRFLQHALPYLIAALCTCHTHAAQAAEYIVGVEDVDDLPIHSTKTNPPSGFCLELLSLFAKNRGDTLSFVPVPIKRLILDFTAANSKIDFKFPDNETWDDGAKRGIKINYSEPLFEDRGGIVMRPESGTPGSPEGIKSMGTVLGFTVAEPYDSLIKSGRIVKHEVPDQVSLVKMALLGRVDAIYLDEEVARYISKSLGNEKGLIFKPSLPFEINKLKLSATKSIAHDKFLSDLNEFLAHPDSAVLALKAKYGIRPIPGKR